MSMLAMAQSIPQELFCCGPIVDATFLQMGATH